MMEREHEVKMDHWDDGQVADFYRGLKQLGSLFGQQTSYRVLFNAANNELNRRFTARVNSEA